MISLRFLRALATQTDKVIDHRDSNPQKEVNALARRHDLEPHWFESRCREKKFSIEVSIQIYPGTVAQVVERPSKVPVGCNSTDVGLNRERDMSSFSL